MAIKLASAPKQSKSWQSGSRKPSLSCATCKHPWPRLIARKNRLGEIEQQKFGLVVSSYLEFAFVANCGPVSLLQFHFIQTDRPARNLQPRGALLVQGMDYGLPGIEDCSK